MPIEIIDRNITDYRIKDEVITLPEVAKLVVQAIEEKSSALDFLRNRERISDMLITSALPSKRSMLFSRRLIQAFDLMSSEEVFNTIQKMSRGIDELYSQDFKESVDNLKTNQPEKFREVAEKVSTMIFPPKVIVDAFETEVQSVDDFLDDLLGDDLFQI